MKIDIVTLFPGMFDGVFSDSIIKRAREKKLLEIKIHNLRDYTLDKHKKVDDRPYGGGPGMVIMAEPVFRAVEALAKKDSKVILLTPQGKKLNQKLAEKISGYKHAILLCGHYEGIDERVKAVVTDEISIGDYVLTCGEIPAMALIDCVARLIPGVLGDSESNLDESFSSGLLEYPQYTRPPVYKAMSVPDILLSGNHKEIEKWRKRQSLAKTIKHRPDLLKK